MRKGRKKEKNGGGEREKKRKKREKNDENSDHNVIASRSTTRTPTNWNARANIKSFNDVSAALGNKYICNIRHDYIWYQDGTVSVYKVGTIINTILAALGALARCLQRRTACNAVPPPKSKMADGSEKLSTPKILAILSNFC